jgi:16S rRNA (cytosine1402-N4)-methyltransferase
MLHSGKHPGRHQIGCHADSHNLAICLQLLGKTPIKKIDLAPVRAMMGCFLPGDEPPSPSLYSLSEVAHVVTDGKRISESLTLEPAPDAGHAPVLLDEAMEMLAPVPDGVYCDATIGLGGHAAEILQRSSPSGRLIGIDRDGEAIARSRERLAGFGDRVLLVHARFAAITSILEEAGAGGLDGCLVDLGVSSMQLDRAERGFSFRRNGPLDMRMDQSQGETAADFLRRADEDEIERILRDLGEERFARKIAGAIVEARASGKLSTTGDLASLVARVVHSRERGKDPATRTFQALRIALNDELGEIEQFLAAAPACLKPGGRLVIISFHSLEDRMVKRKLRALAGHDHEASPSLRILTKHVVTASAEERQRNPRSRSAKLRAAERLPS